MRTDFGDSPIKTKIRNTEQFSVDTMLVISGHEMDAGAVNVRFHGKCPQGAKLKGEVFAENFAAIRRRFRVGFP